MPSKFLEEIVLDLHLISLLLHLSFLDECLPIFFTFVPSIKIAQNKNAKKAQKKISAFRFLIQPSEFNHGVNFTKSAKISLKFINLSRKKKEKKHSNHEFDPRTMMSTLFQSRTIKSLKQTLKNGKFFSQINRRQF
jgi:hypothetical protein